MLTKIIMLCEECGQFDTELEVDITLDVSNKQYVFEATCPDCDELVTNTIDIGSIKL